jgi:plasmid stabilization system protein ParE
MTHTIVLLRKAEEDLDRITGWIVQRSPAGAARWVAAFQDVIARLETHPEQCALAPESEYVGYEIRQAIFNTRRGIPYRVLYTIIGAEVRVLRIRGAGQDLVQSDDL